MASTAAAELNTITEQRSEIRRDLEQAEGAVSLAQRWDEYREAVVAYNDAAAAILTELGEVIEFKADAPRESLAAARDEASELLAEARRSKADGEIASARSAGASDLLAGTDDDLSNVSPAIERPRTACRPHPTRCRDTGR